MIEEGFDHEEDPEWCWYSPTGWSWEEWTHDPNCQGVKAPQECPGEWIP